MFKRSVFATVFIVCIVTKLAFADIDCSTQTYIPQIECEALVSLYNSTNGPTWSNNAGWLTDSDPHNWDGVYCNGGNIQSLYLSSNQLSGIIPAETGNLSILQYLYLDNNQLSNSIPEEIGNLSNLRFLYLYENQLSGPIPPEIGNLSNLELLSLYENQLSDPIPAEIGNLSNLQSLSLGNNQLSGSIPPEIGNLSNLESLSLGNNQLSGSIPSEIGNLPNLQTLSISGNQLSGPIPLKLGNLSNLQYLYLSSNQLSGPIPLPVAQLGESIGVRCHLHNNNDLCIPDITEYQAIGVDPICYVPLSPDCILQGDLNGDGTIDLKDIIIGLKMLAGSTSVNILIFSDVDDNDQIGMSDVLYSLAEIAQ